MAFHPASPTAMKEDSLMALCQVAQAVVSYRLEDQVDSRLEISYLVVEASQKVDSLLVDQSHQEQESHPVDSLLVDQSPRAEDSLPVVDFHPVEDLCLVEDSLLVA